jgi:hypothetical protein
MPGAHAWTMEDIGGLALESDARGKRERRGTMTTCARKGIALFVTLAVVAGLAVLGLAHAQVEDKRAISWKTSGAHTKYTQQHAIDVGDVPGHQIRVLEIHRTFPANPPVFEGVKVVEDWSRGYSDYVNVNGRAWGYGVLLLEQGDKIFYQWDGASHTIVNADGSRKSTYTGTTRLTGGTRKFQGIRGSLRGSFVFDPKAGMNEGQTEGEYWLEK